MGQQKAKFGHFRHEVEMNRGSTEPADPDTTAGTGTNPLSGAYNNVTSIALDFGGTLRTPASQAACLSSSASITGGGTVTYAQF